MNEHDWRIGHRFEPGGTLATKKATLHFQEKKILLAFLDLAEALNSIDRGKLLNKLSVIGVTGRHLTRLVC